MKLEGDQRTWAILAALAALVLLAYYLLEVQGIGNSRDEATYVWDVEPERIEALRVTEHASGSEAVLERDEEGNWHMTEPFNRPVADLSYVDPALTLSELQVHRTIEEPPAGELVAYGLLTPTYTIEVQVAGDQTLVLDVGWTSPRGTYYARREGERAVILLPGYGVEDVTRLLTLPGEVVPSTPGVGIPGPAATSEP
jgi:hypothetical protein